MSINNNQLNRTEYNASTRLLYATGVYVIIFALILPVFNTINHSPSMGSGFIYGLTAPIKSIMTILILTVTGFFAAINKKLITQITLCTICLSSTTLSTSINLIHDAPQLFRLLIFISIVYAGYALDTRAMNSLLIAVFALIGYLCGMSRGINLPETICCANYLYGTIITSTLIMAGATAFGSVFSEYTTDKIRHLTSRYIR